MSRFSITSALIALLIVIGANDKAFGQEVSGNLSFMSSGISPVPSFSTDKSVIYGDITVDYGGISILTDMAFNSNGHIWFSDIWVRYNLEKNMRIGLDWSTFGQNYITSSHNQIRESTRYLAFEFYGEKSLGRDVTGSLKYWYSHGLGKRTTQGVFTMISLSVPWNIEPVTVSFQPSIFYTNFAGKNVGLFLSGITSVSHDSIPLSLSVQSVPPVTTNIPGGVDNQTSIALTYSF